jgi:fatty acid elongase 3
VHNLFLILLSFGMLVGVVWAAYQRYVEDGYVGGLLCTQRPSERLWDGPLGAVTYVFYLSKYYEFVDTFVLALRKKPTIPLHLWHHAVMPVMTWSWFAFPWVDGAWWCVMVNSFIHTLMYTNYLLTSLGMKVWWAKYLTQAQIVQFLTGTTVSVIFFYMKNTGSGCTGDARTAIASNAVNFTFILLFIKVRNR